MKRNSYKKEMFVMVGCLLLLSRQAHAYIDPGTTSLAFQMIIAAFVGALCTIKVFWGKIKIFYKKLFCQKGKYELKDIENDSRVE